MLPKEKKETNSEVDSKSDQKDIGRDAVNSTSSSQDTYNINNFFIIHPDAVESVKNVISNLQKKLKVSIEEDDQIKSQKIAWEKTDGIFSLLDDPEETVQLIEGMTFSEGRKKLTQDLEPIIDIVDGKDKTHLINAIEIYCREDEIDDCSKEEIINEKQEELGARRALINQSNPTFRSRYKKVYNLLRADEIQTKFIVKLKEIEETNTNQEKIKSEFISFWNKILDSHPNKVFCSAEVMFREDDIKDNYIRKQICDRLDKGIKKVFLYSRGKRLNDLAISLAKDIKEKTFPYIDIETKTYFIAKVAAMMITFINNSD